MAQKDLIPFNKLTEDKQKELASKGGKASVETRRRKKLIKEQMNMLLSLPLKNNKLKEQLRQLGIEDEEMTNQMAMIISMWNKVVSKGDVQAFNSIRDTIGEKPKEEVEVVGEINNPFKELTKEELEKLANDK